MYCCDMRTALHACVAVCTVVSKLLLPLLLLLQTLNADPHKHLQAHYTLGSAVYIITQVAPTTVTATTSSGSTRGHGPSILPQLLVALLTH